MTQEKLRKLEADWDKKKTEDQNRSEILWKVMWDMRDVHRIKLGIEEESMPKLKAIITEVGDESWKALPKRGPYGAVWKESQVQQAYLEDLEAVFGRIEEPDKEATGKQEPYKRVKTH